MTARIGDPPNGKYRISLMNRKVILESGSLLWNIHPFAVISQDFRWLEHADSHQNDRCTLSSFRRTFWQFLILYRDVNAVLILRAFFRELSTFVTARFGAETICLDLRDRSGRERESGKIIEAMDSRSLDFAQTPLSDNLHFSLFGLTFHSLK
jgi:hypothetical protein